MSFNISLEMLYFLNMDYVLKGGEIVNKGFPVGVMISGACVITYLILKAGKSLYRKKDMVPFIQKCQIVVGGRGVCLKGFVDTGNRLYDDKRGCPVLVISSLVVEKYNLKPYLTEKTGVIKTRIIRDPSDRKKFKTSFDETKGKLAISYYKCIACYGDYSLFRVRILTGRTHQIRVHLKLINCPILGDEVYSRIDKKFHLIYEKGGKENPYSVGISAVEFDLEWLLEK